MGLAEAAVPQGESRLWQLPRERRVLLFEEWAPHPGSIMQKVDSTQLARKLGKGLPGVERQVSELLALCSPEITFQRFQWNCLRFFQEAREIGVNLPPGKDSSLPVFCREIAGFAKSESD